MYYMQEPTYTGVDGCAYQYTPPQTICSLRRFNIAKCARQRMSSAVLISDDSYLERWKGERNSFWTTLARAIPDNFK